MKKVFAIIGKLFASVARKLWHDKVYLVAAALVWFVLTPHQLLADVPAMARDYLMINVAHVKAGAPIPLDADYSGSKPYCEDCFWNVETNSKWMNDRVMEIVPFFAYEGLANRGIYPALALWFPYPDEDSLTVGGTTFPDWAGDIVILNHRYLYDDYWHDARQAFAVLVHELVHVQGSNFLEYDDSVNGGTSKLEAYTSAGESEILAAMCNFGNSLSCKAFWLHLEDMLRGDLKMRMGSHGLGSIYELVANTHWRDAVERQAAEKSSRFWADNQDELLDLLSRYNAFPLNNYVIPGACYKGWTLPTGDPFSPRMPMDDTKAMLGWTKIILCGGKVL